MKTEEFKESIKESLKKIKILENHDPNAPHIPLENFQPCDVCGSPVLNEKSEKGTRCYICNPEKK